MKTAMQELIEIFNHELKLGEATLSNDEGYMLKWAIFNSKTLLEKEKEQIKDAYADGLNAHRTNFCNRDEYYNQTYNQTNVGNDGFEFDNSSTIPPPKTNNL
jgi:hypothetical protein